jgi:four helix bundle protein
MPTAEKIEDLMVWQKARKILKELYSVSKMCGSARDYALQDQLRRSSISILSNIAEGFERGSNKEFIQFLFIAKGSAGEARTQLYIALDLGYITIETFNRLNTNLMTISKQISRLAQYLKSSPYKGAKQTR